MVRRILQHRLFRQFMKFSLVGVFNTLVDLLVYYVLTRDFGMHYLWANTIAIIVAMTTSFIGNKFFTFKDPSTDYFSQYSKVIIINTIGLGLGNLLVYLFVEHLHIFDIYAKMLSIMMVALFNFTTLKYWAFKGHPEE